MCDILVAGGAGFLGSHLCRRLVAEGNRVTCFDNFQTGGMENVADLIGRPAFRLFTGDVKDSQRLNCVDDGYDQIFNMACPASPRAYQKDPIDTMLTNVVGTENLLHRARTSNARFLQASTSEVYGCPEKHPQNEDYWGNVNPIGVRACYDEGKRAAETLCMDYRRKHGTDAKIVRIFNTFGPGMRPDDGRVVSNFIMQALRDEPIPMYGDGTQTRSFCYVDDLIDGLIRMMNSNLAGPVNLGNPNEFDMHHLANIICGLITSTSRYVYEDLPEDDPKVRCPNITLARMLLGWEPKVELREGLKKTIAYFKGLM
jgi:UDP-glucuronate decarboxylase